RVFLALFDAAGAEAELTRALELGANRDIVRALMAEALLLQNRADAALEWMSGGSVPISDAAYAARTLGRIHMALGDTARARSAFDQALGFAPDDSMLWTDIARFRRFAADQAGAADATTHAVELDPRNVRALQLRGELIRSQFGLAAALPWFERALAIDPNDVSVLAEYAATLGDMGRMRDMLNAARQIVALQPTNPRGYFLQAVLAARAGEYSLARNLIQKTGDALSDVPAVMQIEGVVEFQLGNYRKAINRFERLADAQPHNRRAAELLARALYAEGEHELLLSRFRTTADRGGASAYLLTLVARSLEAIGDGQAATDYLARAANPDLAPLIILNENDQRWQLAQAAGAAPGNAQMVIPYIRALVAERDFEAATRLAEPLAAVSPGVPDAQLLLGDVYLASGAPARALPFYERAAALSLSEPVVRRLVVAYSETGRGDDANAVLVRLVGYSPAHTGALRLLANAYIDTGNWAQASILLKGLQARLGNNQPVLLTDLALAEVRMGRPADAVRHARLAYHVQPGNALATHIRGLAQSEADGNAMVAVELLEKAKSLNPRNPWLRYHLARAYAEAGKNSQAVSALRASLSLGAFPERAQASAMLRALQPSG
uniref:tetratricopeptide repeat protein n=1 Tax=Blastomonas sp. TaxID=1909299 RepID=UPI003593D2EB